MATVTLADGTKRDVTQANYQAVARDAMAAEKARGRAVDEAALYRAIRQLAGQEVEFYTYNPDGAKPAPDTSASAVLNNWGVRLSEAASSAAGNVAEWTARAAAALPDTAKHGSDTLRIVFISSAVAIVAAAAAVVVVKLKR